jgi:hypothetical protein
VIKFLKVERYRSLYDFELGLRPLTILIGRNDAGKSNILRALQLLLNRDLAEKVEKYDWSRIGEDWLRTSPRFIDIKAELAGDVPLSIWHRIEVLEEKHGRSTSFLVSNFPLENEKDANWHNPSDGELSKIPIFYYFHPRTGALQETFDPERENQFYSLLRGWVPSDLSDKRGLDRLMRAYESTNKKNAQSGYLKLLEEEIHAALNKAFPTDYARIILDPKFRGDANERNRIHVGERDKEGDTRSRFRIPLDHHGTGLISTTAMVTSIAVLREYHRQKPIIVPFIIGIEEPEVHLNPGAQRTLVQYFKDVSEEIQILTTTHSSIFVDRIDPDNVVVLRRASSTDEEENNNHREGSTFPILDDHENNWRGLINELGIPRSDILMGAYGVNVLVEGESEMILLPAMLKKYGELYNNELREVSVQQGLQSLILTLSTSVSYETKEVLVILGQGSKLSSLATLLTQLGGTTLVLLDNDRGGREAKGRLYGKFPADCILMPGQEDLPLSARGQEDYEIEDLLESETLLSAWKESIKDDPDYTDVLNLSYQEFRALQTQRTKNRKGPQQGAYHPYCWIETAGIIAKRNSKWKTTNKKPEELIKKRPLAVVTERYILNGKMPVPDFYVKKVIPKLLDLLRKHG